MGIFFSLFKKKSLDCEMDNLHEQTQSMRRNRSFSVSIIANIKRFQLVSILLGGTLSAFSFYYFVDTNDKLWFRVSVGSVSGLLLILILLHVVKSLLFYRVKTLEDRIILQENKLREMFSNYLDEGSYKKVLLLKKKYDPTNRILKDVIMPDPVPKPATKPAVPKKSAKSDAKVEKKTAVDPRPEVPQPSFKTYKNRGVFEKLIDRILGDGPEFRNALICKMCHTHNGLVPPEDFLKISFKCYKCNFHHYPRRNIGLATPCVLDGEQLQSNTNVEETNDATSLVDDIENKVEKTDDSINFDDTLPKPNFDDVKDVK